MNSGIKSNEIAGQETSKSVLSTNTPTLNLITRANIYKHIQKVLNLKWHKHWIKQNIKLDTRKNNIQSKLYIDIWS